MQLFPIFLLFLKDALGKKKLEKSECCSSVKQRTLVVYFTLQDKNVSNIPHGFGNDFVIFFQATISFNH